MDNKTKITKEEIEKVYKDTLENHSSLTSYYFYRRITFWISSRILLKTPVTPNQVAVFGLIITTIAAFLITKGNYPYLIMAAVLIQIGYMLDCMDGEIARLKKMCSNFGAWLDATLDIVKMTILYFALGIAYFHQSGKTDALILLSLLIASRLFLNSIMFMIEKNFSQQVNKVFNFSAIQKIGKTLKIKPELLTFSDDIKYLILTFGVLLNQPKFTMIFFIFIHFFLWFLAVLKTVIAEYSK